MATFLWRLEGEPRATTAPFSDVPRGRYFSEAIDWLFERGITTGTGGRRFSPDAVVTRGQMAAFLWRLAGSPA
ncbi:MAG: S-layer homology domain-containing protein [Acidimicrobiales bacterium]